MYQVLTILLFSRINQRGKILNHRWTVQTSNFSIGIITIKIKNVH